MTPHRPSCKTYIQPLLPLPLPLLLPLLLLLLCYYHQCCCCCRHCCCWRPLPLTTQLLLFVACSDRHDQPSQGDWSLVHSAAVVATGTEGFTMEACQITRADGQGLLLEGYHRDARILRNDFEWIGSHAMVSWGRTSSCLNANCSRRVPNGGDGPDGRDGEQPIGTLVQGNTVHEAGLYERQGTMWNQALSAETRLEGNIFFNCDRYVRLQACFHFAHSY